MMRYIALAALSIQLLTHYTLAVVPVTGPMEQVCGGQTNTGPAGQFGYSVAMTDGTANTTYMVVGKPWDSSVHIYSAATPNRTYTNQNVPNPVNNPSWQPAGYIMDSSAPPWTTFFDGRQGNSSYARSYFGHSVDITKDGSFVAVGIPGRNMSNYRIPYTGVTYSSLNWAPFHGEVRVYTRPAASPSNWTTAAYTTLMLPFSTYRAKFGHQVKFSMDGQYLFVATNGGWDGVWIDLMYNPNAGCTMPSFTDLSKSFNMTGLNVYVYKQASGLFTLQQYFPVISPVPFGQAGVRLDTFGSGLKTTLQVRSFKRNTSGASTSGGLSMYTLSGGQFALNGSYYNRDTTDGTNTHSWDNEDWFGYSLASGYDAVTDRLIIAGGAPRDGSAIYTLYASSATGVSVGSRSSAPSGLTPWQSLTMQFGINVVNDAFMQRNFFGGNVYMTPDARFLYVGDATNANGRGQVQVFMLRNGTVGNIAALGYETVVIPQIANGYTNATIVGLPYVYDHITTLSGNLTDYTIGQNASLPAHLFAQDSFGKEVAGNMFWTAVGAPAGDCVYTFASLTSYVVPPVIADTGNSTNAAPTNSGTSNNSESNKNALYIGLGAGLGVALLAIPGAFFALRNQHKKKLIARLEAQKALAQLEANPWENPALPQSIDSNANLLGTGSRVIG